jgi:hypothetical protein
MVLSYHYGETKFIILAIIVNFLDLMD